MATTHYDVLVIGSGQAGNPVAKAFANAGRKTAVVERAALGGTCVNTGCTPTKTMIASGRAAYVARRAAEYGVDTGESPVAVDMARVRQRKSDIVAQWNSGSVGGLKSAGVEVLMGQASFVGDGKVKVALNDGGGEVVVSAETVFVNVGERAARPEIPGLQSVDASRVLDSTTIMELAEVPTHLVVLGGGYIGLEFGQLFRRLGADVTIIQRAAQLVPREDEDVAQCLLEILREDGITVHLSSIATSISRAKVPSSFLLEVEGSSHKVEVSGSHLLIATGRVPYTDGLNLSAAGIETTPKGHIIVDEKLQTTAPGVYALGDVHGGPAFTHISYDDFRIIRTNFLSDHMPSTTPLIATTRASRSRTLNPYCVYTDPQLGHVGWHIKDLDGSERKVRIAKMPMSYVARALETAEPRGVMKAAVDAQTGEILGFTCLGVEGGEIMSIVQTAMMGGLKWWDLEAAVYAHPTLAESLNNLWGHLK